MNFNDKYKSLVTKKTTDLEILENPIMAMVNGIPPDKVRHVLLANGWSAEEVTALFTEIESMAD